MDFTLLDTGPLVAFLHRDDQYHSWAKQQLALLSPPFLTCEAVLTEAHYLLRSLPHAQQAMTGMVKDQLVQVAFRLEEEIESVDEFYVQDSKLANKLN